MGSSKTGQERRKEKKIIYRVIWVFGGRQPCIIRLVDGLALDGVGSHLLYVL